MTIGQAKAKPYWLALCLTDVFIKPLFSLVCTGNLGQNQFH